MPYSNFYGITGNQQIALFGLPDSTPRHQPGMLLGAVDNYWGAAEFLYLRAFAPIRQSGLCLVLPSLQSTGYRFDAAELPNTANVGRSVAVANTAMAAGNYGWFMIKGICPLNCAGALAGDSPFGIGASGQGGAVTAGKQILNARIIVPSTNTVVKNSVTGNSGSTRLLVNGSDGWFIGAYLSGAGIAAGTVIVDMDSSGTSVVISAATTALVNGPVTATYNNGVVFYNVAYLNRAFAQGQIV